MSAADYLFLSTLSLRRATAGVPREMVRRDGDFYPRSPCGERLEALTRKQDILHFYPRSPCGERHPVRHAVVPGACISIHALLAESDIRSGTPSFPGLVFLSTLSLRRATCRSAARRSSSDDFYPRSPCGERRAAPRSFPMDPDFYPRSPCGERHPGG